MLVLLILIFLSVLYLTLKEDRITKINKKIKGPKGKLFVGNLFDLKKPGKELHEIMHDLYLQHGNIFRMRFGAIETIVLSEYSTIKEGFVDNAEALQDRYVRKSRLRASKGLNIGNSNGEYYKFLYSTISSELTATKLKKVVEGHIKSELIEFSNFMDGLCESGKEFHYNLYARIFTLNCILRSLFSINYPYIYIDPTIDIGNCINAGDDSGEGTEDENSIKKLIDLIGNYVQNGGKVVLGDFFPLLYFIFKSKPKSFFQSYDELKKHMSQFVDRSMEKIKDEDFNTYKPENIIEALLVQYKLGNIVYEAVLANSLDLLLGGIDTSANTLSFSMIAILNNNLQDKLYNSIVSTFRECKADDSNNEGDGADSDNDNHNISKENNDRVEIFLYSKYKFNFNYLASIIKETFRRFPPVPLGLQHRCTQDIEIAGYKIAKGTQFFQNIYSSHMNSNHWEKPDQFIPERFENNNLHQKLGHYGIGLRKCIGFIMSDAEIFSFLATIFYRYKFINPLSPQLLNDKGKFSLALQAPKAILKVEKRINNKE